MGDPATPPLTVDGMAIRRAWPDDAEVVHHVLSTAPVPRDVTLEQLREQFEQLPLDDGRGQWVVEVGGGVVGWMSLRYPNDNAGGLEVSVYLEPGFTGHGRACRLVEEILIPVAKSAGVEFLTATPDTPHAERFLKNCGFERRRAEPGNDPIAAKLDQGFERADIFDRRI